jgi:endonuclease/exonuclease/phosphatase family metal-dependent hydrolase
MVRNFNVLIVVLTLLSYFAPHTPPDKSWLLIFLGLGYPWLLLANFLFIVYWTLRWEKWAFLSVGALLLGLGNIPLEVGLHPNNKKQPADTIKIMTYNVNYVELSRFPKSKVQMAAKMNQFLQNTDAQILALQECAAGDKNWTSHCAKLPYLRTYPYYTLMGKNQVNIASKYPIIAQGMIPIFKGNGTNGCTYADIQLGGQILRVYALHLQSNKISMMADNVAQNGNIKDEETWSSIETMLRIVKRNTKIRAEQARQIRQHLNQSPYPVLVLGDFNDNPMSYVYRTIAENLNDGFEECAFGRGTTYSGNIPGLKIDHILASPNLHFGSYDIVRVPYSDHYPTIAQVHLKP